MRLLLIRNVGNAGYTSGTLLVDGEFQCFTLEDEEREIKIKDQTAIPLGTYSVALSLSQRFGKKLPLLLNVPNFQGVRIHSGNYAGQETFYKKTLLVTLRDVLHSEEYIEVLND